MFPLMFTGSNSKAKMISFISTFGKQVKHREHSSYFLYYKNKGGADWGTCEEYGHALGGVVWVVVDANGIT